MARPELRFAPLLGALFVVLAAVAYVVAGDPPSHHEQGAEIRDPYDSKTKHRITAFLGALGAVPLLFFAGDFRAVLRCLHPSGRRSAPSPWPRRPWPSSPWPDRDPPRARASERRPGNAPARNDGLSRGGRGRPRAGRGHENVIASAHGMARQGTRNRSPRARVSRGAWPLRRRGHGRRSRMTAGRSTSIPDAACARGCAVTATPTPAPR
jgi:hypothetical protein